MYSHTYVSIVLLLHAYTHECTPATMCGFEETSMKWISSFGFTPLSKQTTEKRPKNTPENTSEQSTQIVRGTTTSFCKPPQTPVSNATTVTINKPSQLSITTVAGEPPFVRNDLSTCNSERLGKLSVDDKIWLSKYAFYALHELLIKLKFYFQRALCAICFYPRKPLHWNSGYAPVNDAFN